jgi:hypothetical protein
MHIVRLYGAKVRNPVSVMSEEDGNDVRDRPVSYCVQKHCGMMRPGVRNSSLADQDFLLLAGKEG